MVCIENPTRPLSKVKERLPLDIQSQSVKASRAYPKPDCEAKCLMSPPPDAHKGHQAAGASGPWVSGGVPDKLYWFDSPTRPCIARSSASVA